MICPDCGTQCKQYKGLGDGNNSESYYDTAMVLYCPGCNAKFIEFYGTFKLGDKSEFSGHVNNLVSFLLNFVDKITNEDRQKTNRMGKGIARKE